MLGSDHLERQIHLRQPPDDTALEQPDSDRDEKREEKSQREEQAGVERRQLLAHRAEVLVQLDGRARNGLLAEHQLLAQPRHVHGAGGSDVPAARGAGDALDAAAQLPARLARGKSGSGDARPSVGDAAGIESVAHLQQEDDGERRDRNQPRAEDDGEQAQPQARRHAKSRRSRKSQAAARRLPARRCSRAARERKGP